MICLTAHSNSLYSTDELIMTQPKANGYHSRSVQIISVDTKHFLHKPPLTVHGVGPVRSYNLKSAFYPEDVILHLS